jgi:hypothetical protein
LELGTVGIAVVITPVPNPDLASVTLPCHSGALPRGWNNIRVGIVIRVLVCSAAAIVARAVVVS